MEYLYLGIGIVLFLIATYLLLQVKIVRNRAYAMFLEAEKNIDEEKLEYVACNLYALLPAVLKIFISYDGFLIIVQHLYDKIRRVAQDVLNDGKFDGQ